MSREGRCRPFAHTSEVQGSPGRGCENDCNHVDRCKALERPKPIATCARTSLSRDPLRFSQADGR